MVDFHWRFNSCGKNAATAWSELCAKPEVVLLRLSNYDDPTSSVTFKDERKLNTDWFCHSVVGARLIGYNEARA
jgi:hypothetical protein